MNEDEKRAESLAVFVRGVCRAKRDSLMLVGLIALVGVGLFGAASLRLAPPSCWIFGAAVFLFALLLVFVEAARKNKAPEILKHRPQRVLWAYTQTIEDRELNALFYCDERAVYTLPLASLADEVSADRGFDQLLPNAARGFHQSLYDLYYRDPDAFKKAAQELAASNVRVPSSQPESRVTTRSPKHPSDDAMKIFMRATLRDSRNARCIGIGIGFLAFCGLLVVLGGAHDLASLTRSDWIAASGAVGMILLGFALYITSPLRNEGVELLSAHPEKIVWVYSNATAQPGAVDLATSVVLCANDGVRRHIPLIQSSDEPEAMRVLVRILPLAIFGYDPHWNEIYKRDPKGFYAATRADSDATPGSPD